MKNRKKNNQKKGLFQLFQAERGKMLQYGSAVRKQSWAEDLSGCSLEELIFLL